MADDSSCNNAAPHATEQQQLLVELSALQQQYQLSQQEVALLQAQVERLSILDRSSDDHAAAASSATSSNSGDTALLQQQLHAAHAELQHTQALLDELMLEHSAAVKAACEQRSGALRLLLAQQIKELQQAQQHMVAAQELAAAKDEDCEAMRTALAAANAHILALTAQQQQTPQHEHTIGPAHHQPQEPGAATAPTHLAGPTSSSRDSSLVVQELQRQLAVQRQQLEVAHEQVRELVQHLALKHDQADFAERRATVLEQQLEEARQKGAEAAAAPETMQRGHSCASIAEEGQADLSLEGALPARQTPSPQPQEQQQQQQQQQPEQHTTSPTKPTGLAGSFTAALSNAASGFSLTGPRSESEHEQPPRQQTPPPLSPFALARKFVADREADALTRLKDELREREQEVAGLAAANSRLETQLHGLQTLLVTKVAQCNRLAQELKEGSRQLRQAEAAAVSDQAVLQQQLEQLSDRVVGLQDALTASAQREQQLQAQLVATRGKLAQVLEALVEDAAALQQHKPAQYKLLMQEMPAAVADVMAAAAATATAVDPTAAASGDCSSGSRSELHLPSCSASSIPALRAASVPSVAMGLHAGANSLLRHPPTWVCTAGAAYSAHGLQRISSGSGRYGPAAAGAAGPEGGDMLPTGLRSFMRSRTISSADGSGAASLLSSTGKGGITTAAPGMLAGDGWSRGVSVASMEVQQQQKQSLSFTAQSVVGGSEAGGAARTPKSAAAKLLDVFRKKGREQEEEEGEAGPARPLAAAAPTKSGRTTGSGDYSYVLLDG